jgi:hypothetical protein
MYNSPWVSFGKAKALEEELFVIGFFNKILQHQTSHRVSMKLKLYYTGKTLLNVNVDD